MNRILSSLAIILFLSGAVLAQEWTWKNFSPPNNSFTILAPGAMRADEEAQEAKSKMGSYSYSDFYGFFAVIYRDYKSGFWYLKPDYSSHFDKVRRDFVKASKGELIKEDVYSKGDITGRNVWIKVPAGQMTGPEGKTITKYRVERLRMFFVGKRFYTLLAVLPADIINTPAVDKYFDSFAAN